MRYVILRDSVLDTSGDPDWLLKYDPDTGQSWIIRHDDADQPPNHDDPPDEWTFEEAEGAVPAEIWARAVAAHARLKQS